MSEIEKMYENAGVEKSKNNQKLKWQVSEKPEQWISFNNPSSYQILQLLDIQEVK